MLQGSFWYPKSWKRKGVLLAVLIMVLLHQSSLLGLMSSEYLVAGWLPLQLAYDFAYQLVGVTIIYAMYRMAPSPPKDIESTMTEQPSAKETMSEEKSVGDN